MGKIVSTNSGSPHELRASQRLTPMFSSLVVCLQLVLMLKPSPHGWTSLPLGIHLPMGGGATKTPTVEEK